MTTPEERFMKLFEGHYVLTGATMRVSAIAAFRDWSTEYATIPRAGMPVLDENGNASNQWYEETDAMPLPQKLRRYAASNLARSEYLEAKEQREADTKAERALSERRNKVLAKVRKRFNSEQTVPYEGLYQGHTFRILVDMIMEAKDTK